MGAPSSFSQANHSIPGSITPYQGGCAAHMPNITFDEHKKTSLVPRERADGYGAFCRGLPRERCRRSGMEIDREYVRGCDGRWDSGLSCRCAW